MGVVELVRLRRVHPAREVGIPVRRIKALLCTHNDNMLGSVEVQKHDLEVSAAWAVDLKAPQFRYQATVAAVQEATAWARSAGTVQGTGGTSRK